MARLIVGLAVVVAATGFAPVPRPKPERQLDLKALAKKLQGTWDIVSTERSNTKSTLRQLSRSSVKYRFDGGRWSYVYPNAIRISGNALGGELKLGTSKEGLVSMDLIRESQPGEMEPVAMMRGTARSYALMATPGLLNPSGPGSTGTVESLHDLLKKDVDHAMDLAGWDNRHAKVLQASAQAMLVALKERAGQ